MYLRTGLMEYPLCAADAASAKTDIHASLNGWNWLWQVMKKNINAIRDSIGNVGRAIGIGHVNNEQFSKFRVYLVASSARRSQDGLEDHPPPD